MRYVLLLLLAIATAVTFVARSSACPTVITVHFTVTGSPYDPLYGSDTAEGWFSFDTAPFHIPEGTLSGEGASWYSPAGLGLSEFFLTWAGQTWSAPGGGGQSIADMYVLSAASWGTIGQLSIGGAPDGYASFPLNLSGSEPDIAINEVAGHTGPGINEPTFAYTSNGVVYYGTWTSDLMDVGFLPVAEPAAASLLGIGLLFLGVAGTRRR